MYLTKTDAKDILKRIQSFESDLNNVFNKRGYNLRNNLGRRNALISLSQEKETAAVLRKKFKDVIEDGAPGKPDIFIGEIEKELECKLTSGSRSKNSISYALQTDWETLCNKKKLDYVYILADQNFDKFCVLFFEGLTPDDFFPPASGSRGKSRMNKGKAMKKVKCLIGSYECHNDKHIVNISNEVKKDILSHVLRMRELSIRLNEVSNKAIKKKEKIEIMKTNEEKRYQNKLEKLTKRLDYWKDSSKRFKFIFEKV